MTANKTFHVLVTRQQDDALILLTPAKSERDTQQRQSSLMKKYGDQLINMRIITTQEAMSICPEELTASLAYNK